MARGAIAYKGQLYLGGSKVEANPTGSAEGGNLSKLGVDDTVYAIPQVNNGTLTIQKNGTNVATFSANQSGNATANIIVPDVEETDTPDTTPFLYRQTPYNADGVFLDELVGGSVAWNQLANSFNYTGLVTTDSNGIVTIDGTASSVLYIKFYSDIKSIANHIYFISAKGLASGTQFYNDSAGVSATSDAQQSIGKATDVKSFYLRISSGTYSNVKFTPILVDLTQMFGTTIADYVYSLEQATAGSGIAWLKSRGFFTKDYYPYNTGELISVKTSGKKYVGKNKLHMTVDGIKEANTEGSWSGNVYTINGGTFTILTDNDGNVTGIKADGLFSATSFFAWSYTQPSGNYILNGCPTGGGMSTYRIDIRNNAAGTVLWDAIDDGNGVSYSAENMTVWANIIVASGSVSNKVFYPMIRLATETDPTFAIYTESTYDISNIDLRGIPKLVNNELVYDGDTYESNGNVTRKYGIVDLGTLDLYMASAGMFIAEIDKRTGVHALMCEGYIYASGTGFDTPDKCISDSASSTYLSYVFIRDDAYSSAASFKTAVTGKKLQYELATPTTETTDSYTNPQICDKDGTEEFIDDRTVPIPVGHNSRYADLPAIMDGDYLSYMARNFASEKYVDRRMDALGDLAYINEDGDNSTKFLRGDGTWQNTPAGVTTLAALTDTTISSPSNGQVLKYDGSKWVNSADYSLPKASADTLGGVKVGANLSIDSNGVLSATGGGGTPTVVSSEDVYISADQAYIRLKLYSNGMKHLHIHSLGLSSGVHSSVIPVAYMPSGMDRAGTTEHYRYFCITGHDPATYAIRCAYIEYKGANTNGDFIMAGTQNGIAVDVFYI